MLEYLYTVGSTFLGCFLGGIVTYVLIRHMTSNDKILDRIEDLSPEITKLLIEMLHNTDNQKIIYSVGTLIGQGARVGAGFGGKPGKFNLEGIIGQFIGKIIGGNGEQQQQQPESNPFGQTS
jgi:hypothetical protein